MANITEKDLDLLCLNACELIGFQSGSTVAYDPAGYDLVERLQVKPGSLTPRDASPEAVQSLPVQAKFSPQPYPARIAGFQRRSIFGPDEIGRQISQNGIVWNDGLGNGLYESLRIDRKYGLKHAPEAPTLGYPLPYLPQDWPAFEQTYSSEVRRFQADLGELEAVYGAPLAKPADLLLVLWCRHFPLSLFAEAYQNNSQAVEADLQKEIGCPVPPFAPSSSVERAVLAKFLALVRRRQSRVLEFQARVLRKAFGSGLKLAANNHELPPLDMAMQGAIFDYPAVAIRPLLLDDDWLLRHYIAYFTQLFHDLTGKPPMVSVRMNLSAASPRFVPRPGLIRRWYDQAVRGGAGSFYLWTRDYPYADDPSVYDGPIPGNTDPSALGSERWQAVLERLGLLAHKQRFDPPAPEVLILVPDQSALLFRQEWRRIYAVFSALCEARIHAGFISDRAVAGSGVPAHAKMMLAPVLEFLSPALRSHLETFAARSALYAVDAPVCDENGLPAAAIQGARPLDPSALDIFPLGRLAEQRNLESLAGILASEVQRSGADAQSWVFDVCCENLPECAVSLLRTPQPDLRFDPWLYEHGSPWIVPYL